MPRRRLAAIDQEFRALHGRSAIASTGTRAPVALASWVTATILVFAVISLSIAARSSPPVASIGAALSLKPMRSRNLPRHDIGVMLQLGQQHLVAGLRNAAPQL